MLNREDFEIFKSGLIYFDNAATTQKPKQVVDSIVEYYTKYTANAHRGDYDISLKVDDKYENVRDKVKKFINADKTDEIIFTKGSTESFNMIVFGFMAHYLKKDDEVILTKSEHASNILPWINLSEIIGFKIIYLDLNEDNSFSIDSLKEKINEKTKVLAIAHITNSIGDVRPIDEIGKICKDNNILFVLDATQSIGHIRVDVKKCNADFLGFSAHKMLGPTGVGVLYGKEEYLDKLVPLEYGGGMNVMFSSDGKYELKELPFRLEAGTRNIAGVIGLGTAIDYINNIGIDNIHEYEIKLKKYLLEKIKKVPNIKIYNENTDSGLLLFNVDNYFSQDVAIFLNNYKICIRAGNHCAKMLQEVICSTNTCRVSLYFYNTEEEIDKLIDALMNQDKILDTVV